MKRDSLRQLVTIIGVVATIVVNALANALPINGQQTGEVSDQFPIYFVPAGYVFAIWGLIYLGLTAFAIFQALPSQRENGRLRSIGGLRGRQQPTGGLRLQPGRAPAGNHLNLGHTRWTGNRHRRLPVAVAGRHAVRAD